MKEEFFSKFKDYNSELEKILEKKDFSRDSKNLLLSMFYKLESSYDDYQTVKRRVKTKQEYLENIIDNIKQCNRIETIKSTDPEFEEWTKENKKYEVDMKLKKIKVIENEISLLSALLELNNFKIYLGEEYNLIRNAFPYMINTANDMNNTEVLRDFNAFSWNITVQDIPNIPINLVYENLKIALTIDIIGRLEYSNINQDIIQLIKENMGRLYDEKMIDEFLTCLFKISIIMYIYKSEAECKRLSEEYHNLEQDLAFMKNKKEYVNHAIQKKQELTKQLKDIELILNDKNLLIQEYEKRNQSLSEYHKIFSLSHLTETLQREKEKVLKRVADYNRSLEPKQYIANKQALQKDADLLKDINFENTKENKTLLYNYIFKLQQILIERVLPQKIEKLNQKEDLVNLIYEIRYYLFIMYDDEKHVKDLEELKPAIDKLLHKLLKKMYLLDMINTLSTNEKNDIQMVSTIFGLNIINLEEIYMELTRENKKTNEYRLTVFDGKETIAETVLLNLDFNKRDKVKLKRKVKLL